MKTVKGISIWNILFLALTSLALSACLQQQQQQDLSKSPEDTSDSPSDSVSVYDKAQMAYHRSNPTAVQLDDGRVLVIGGLPYPIPATEYTEIYDPSTNTWSLGPSPVVSRRSNFTALKLPDGRVLVLGGTRQDNGDAESEVLEIEAYDPIANSFSVVGNLSHSRNGASIILLDNGKVFISGGVHYQTAYPQFTYYSDVEIFDPITNSLTYVDDMNSPKVGHTSVQIGDYVYVIGGIRYDQELNNVEVFRVSQEKFLPFEANPLWTARYDPYTFLFPDNTILVVGGSVISDGVQQTLTSVEASSSNGGFDILSDLSHAIFAAGTTQLLNGTPILVGGTTSSNTNCTKDINAYDSSSKAFVSIGELKTTRCNSAVITLSDNSILVIGGQEMTNDPNDYYSERIDLGSITLP